MVLQVIGWIVWVFVALYALASFAPHPDGGVQWMKRTQATILVVALAITAFAPISPFHLIWILPIAFMAPMSLMQRRVKIATTRFEQALHDPKNANLSTEELLKKLTDEHR